MGRNNAAGKTAADRCRDQCDRADRVSDRLQRPNGLIVAGERRKELFGREWQRA
jgi:hypothetical protein